MQESKARNTARNPQQVSKRHHYTPEFYLRSWADEAGNIGVVQNFGGRIHRGHCAPKATGFEYDLYSYTENFNTENRAEIETDFFSRLDSEGAKIISKVINNENPEKNQRVLFAQFIAGLRVRNPDTIKKIRAESTEGFLEDLEAGQAEYEARKRDIDPPTFREWVELNRPGLIENIGVGQIPKIISMPMVLSDILKMSWYTVDFKASSKPLLTSDRPLVKWRGLGHPDCIIALPLSPRYGFFAFRDSSRVRDKLMRTPPNKLASALNANVVGQAIKYAYCSSDTDAPDSFFRNRLKSIL